MKKQILIAVGVIVVTFFATSQYYQRNISAMESVLHAKTNETAATMVTLAKALSVAQPEPVVAALVRDCPVRTQYEELLVRLNTLTPTELSSIKALHTECGDYYATMMSVMAMRLSDMFKQYEVHVSSAAALGTDVAPYKLDVWRSLVAKETARAELLTKQSQLQGEIIDALRARDETVLTTLLSEAQSVTGSIEVLGIQLASDRDAVVQ